MVTQLSRFAPLTGVVYALLTLFAFGTASGAPSSSASGMKVIAFYESHRTSARVSDLLWMLAFAFLVLFAGTLRSHLRRKPSAEALSSVVLAGAAVFAAGAVIYFDFDFALAAVPSHLAPAAAQALNVLALNMQLAASAGGLVFGLTAGLAILRGDTLPNWLGWSVIVIGLIAATPAFIFALVLFALWAATAGIVIWRRTPGAPVPA
ncbi:MAG TPA: hypothetical protein VLJ44_11230 [Gaiellaceae bacterium]|nr:hypothetical protein [Gaiellaceae bacterium]